MSRSTDIRIVGVEHSYQDWHFRTPIKFGGVALDRATLLDVWIDVETADGRRARGFGSMPLGATWSFPSRVLTYDQTLAAMKTLAERIADIMRRHRDLGHPIDLGTDLEPQFVRAASEIPLAEPMPHLCTLVVSSPFDAALHDAFGKLHKLNVWHAYGPDFMNHDLGRFLGKDFAGEQLERYIHRTPQPRMPLYHLVGALDPLVESDVKTRIGDGLPETLPEWIDFNGLTHLKIKLNGDDLGWDVERVVSVDRIAAETQARRGTTRWYYSLDFNERCRDVGYLLEFLSRVQEQAPAGYDRVQYIEQPTARDLKADRGNVMHEAAKRKPIVIDESLIDLESLHLAREMGYSGAALKACKGQGASLLMAAAAQKMGLFLCVQDLTCPGASLLQSASLAAHIPGVAAVESNSRQYCPAANEPWVARFPGIFRVVDGTMETGVLTGLGLGAVE